ncbi:MAG: ankyrin repeat domain-containing protein [Alphaproteobacteria bacterium]|nr:MAG: ankyrin repeat domain-containing protein [Alphaproteobacteria bacterium]
MSPAKLSSVFLKAARNGDEEKVKSCLQQGMEVDHAYNLAFGLAAKNGHIGVLEILMEHGADPKDPDALRWAAQDNRGEVVRLLLENGADFDEIPKALQTRFRADWNRSREEKAWRACEKEHSKITRHNNRHRNLRQFVRRGRKL